MSVPLEHGNCPHCGESLDGDSIWQTGYDMKYHPCDFTREAMADAYAECYGASRTKGRWGLKIGIYDRDLDRTVKWRCPYCEGEWDR